VKHAVMALIAVSITASAAGCSGPNSGPSAPVGKSQQSTGMCGAEPHPRRYFGVIDDYPGSPAYDRFIGKARIRPTLDDSFFDFGRRWTTYQACYAVKHGAMPLIQINLRHVSAARIAGGSYDRYIVRMANKIKKFGSPIVLSIGHEMNGSWYSWGWHHTPVATFVSMWHRIHNIFARQHATNVTWMWTVNRAVKPAVNPAPWWPGKAYVNWVGIDGHDRHPTDSFTKVFGSTIADIRQLTTDPILISETAVVAGPGRPAQIANLFRTVYQTPGLIGIIYLNMRTVRIDWRLQDKASIRAFTNALRPYESAVRG
jgi:mannan endo-1,4-beta-mannosidase